MRVNELSTDAFCVVIIGTILSTFTFSNIFGFEMTCDLVEELKHYNLTLAHPSDWTCLTQNSVKYSASESQENLFQDVQDVNNIIIGDNRFWGLKIRCESRRYLSKNSTNCTHYCDKFPHDEISESECAKRIFQDVRGEINWNPWNTDIRRLKRNLINSSELEIGESNCNCTIIKKELSRTELAQISLEFGRVISHVIKLEKNVSTSEQRGAEENNQILRKLNETNAKISKEAQSCSESIASLKVELYELKKELKLIRDNFQESLRSKNIDVPALVKQKVGQIFRQY